MAVYTRPDESQALGVEIPVVPLGNILPRVFVASVPSGLSTREGTREAVASGLEIEDGVDRCATCSDSDHDRVLI